MKGGILLKVSEITAQDVANYLRLDSGSYTDTEINGLISASKSFVSAYTGIPQTSTDVTVKTLDDYEDFVIAVYVLCQDMYDNRDMYVDKSNVNKVVETILGMHCVNLI